MQLSRARAALPGALVALAVGAPSAAATPYVAPDANFGGGSFRVGSVNGNNASRMFTVSIGPDVQTAKIYGDVALDCPNDVTPGGKFVVSFVREVPLDANRAFSFAVQETVPSTAGGDGISSYRVEGRVTSRSRVVGTATARWRGPYRGKRVDCRTPRFTWAASDPYAYGAEARLRGGALYVGRSRDSRFPIAMTTSGDAKRIKVGTALLGYSCAAHLGDDGQPLYRVFNESMPSLAVRGRAFRLVEHFTDSGPLPDTTLRATVRISGTFPAQANRSATGVLGFTADLLDKAGTKVDTCTAPEEPFALQRAPRG